ncbi:uncharacterized protein LOC130813882 isoform X2 [Amaranthus tricolor]|uniref:uncharacterized protein LOC130813882 isoform X2 n=1 Tax=Amaranthus tricolor TaxID=29722 RepID=UPI0025879E1E|nr:uncharacterized protein LOC130813882 isoform X2 [Amaranthus tricolor]
MLYQFFVSNLVEGISGPRLTILSKGCSSTLTLPSLCSQSIKFFSTIYRGVAMPLEAVIYKHYLIGLSLSNVSSAGATGIFLSVKIIWMTELAAALEKLNGLEKKEKICCSATHQSLFCTICQELLA